MDATTREALEQSIAKWWRNAEVTDLRDARLGPTDCPLCMLFWRSENRVNDCRGCPVYAQTATKYCGDTPFERAEAADNENDLDVFREAAADEARFLASLLPLVRDAPPLEQKPGDGAA